MTDQPADADRLAESSTVLLPVRLIPYIHDLVKTGLYGKSVEDVVITLLETMLQEKVQDGLIRVRKDGKRAKE